MRTLRCAAAAALLMLGLAVGSVATAPAARANPIQPAQINCGWTTCTSYWSVEQTQELNETWKEAVMFGYAGSGAGVGAFGGPAGALAGTLAGGYKAAEFAVQVGQAAREGRCLIFKYPKIAPAAGWWGSVSTNNQYCVS